MDYEKDYVLGQLYKNKVNVISPKSVNMSEYANGRIPSYLSYQNNNVVNVTDILKNFPLPTWYTQYADQSGNFIAYEEPNNWYKKTYGVTSTWELMFNTDSVAFITEGNYSNDGRSSGIQGDAIRNITASAGSNGIGFIQWANGANRLDIYANEVWNAGTTQNPSSWAMYRSWLLKASNQVPIAQVNRMRNRLIRVYHLLSINGKPVSEIVTGA